jgi:hypothetical protein
MSFCLDCGLYSKEKINVNPIYACRCASKPVKNKKICPNCNLYENGANPLYLCKCKQTVAPKTVESFEPRHKPSKPKPSKPKAKPKAKPKTKPKAKPVKNSKYVRSRTVENPNSEDGRFYDYIPTEKEIEEKTAEFRKKWTEEDYCVSSGHSKASYEVPVVSISDLLIS